MMPKVVGNDQKIMLQLGSIILIIWMLADAQTNIGSSGAHAQQFSHWKIRADDHDIIS